MSLQDLKNAILQDGIIDKEEVRQIELAIYADGKIDKEEADFLFELNDATSGKNNSPEWKNLFVKGISDYILQDGVVDENEVDYLAEKINGDGQIDENEKALLENIKSKASQIHDKFNSFGL